MTTNNDANEPGAPVQTATLNEGEVIKRLMMVKNPKVTNELYTFGEMMVDEVVDRLKTLETKATWLAAYSIGLITVLVSTQAKWNGSLHPWATSALGLSGVIAFGAAVFAVSALSLKSFPFFGHHEWLNIDYLDDEERLRKQHIIAMHGVHSSYREHCNTKASRIRIAQALLVLSALLLVLALGDFVATFAPIGTIAAPR